MSDFVIQFGERVAPQRLGEMLTDRPGVGSRRARVHRFAWGAVVVQRPPGPAWDESTEDGEIICVVGRPMLVGRGGEEIRPDAVARVLRSGSTSQVQRFHESLGGMFVLARCIDQQVQVLTDQMGCRPVYVAKDDQGEIKAIGTFIEAVAVAAGRQTQFDTVSLGELLVHQNITFPHTTRRAVCELEPASLHTVRLEGSRPDLTTESFWLPREPARTPSDHQIEEQLEDALIGAARDIGCGSSTVAVTLSGGADSRAVLALLPKSKTAAVTFATRINHEVRVATSVADTWGVPHWLARRGPDFYPRLFERAPRLIGSELLGAAHGFAIADNGLDSRFDVIVGGFLSDTLLKGHFMPQEQRRRHRTRTIRDVAGAALRRLRPDSRAWWQHGGGSSFTDGSVLLHERVRDQVADRRRKRLSQLEEIRPDSAVEWSNFWPASREVAMAYPLANSRLFEAEELFMHRRIVSVATAMPPRLRCGGKVSTKVFKKLCGVLERIENANLMAKLGERESRESVGQPGMSEADDPWNEVDHSWADYATLQQRSTIWVDYRRKLLKSSPTLDLLSDCVRTDPRTLVGSYQGEYGDKLNLMLIQLGLHVDRLMGGT